MIVPSHNNKFVKSYEFDLIIITEIFFFNSVIKNAFYNYNNYCIFSHLTIFRARGLRPVLRIFGGLSSLKPPYDFRL
jgi:hypothetical protein